MNEPIIPPPPRETIIRHKRERNLQILLPIIVFSILTIAASVFIAIAIANGGEAERWAAISIICLAIPIMFMSLIVIAVLSGMIYASAQVYKETPTYSSKAIDAIETAAVQVKYYSDIAAKPVIMLKTWLGVPEKMSNKTEK